MPRARRRAAPRSSATCSAAARRATASTAPAPSPDGMPAITAIREALDDAGLAPDDIDYINAHGTSTPENDKMEAMSCTAVFGERMAQRADLVEQVDDRPHADGRRRRRGGDVAPDHRATAASRRRSTTQVPDPAIPLDVVPNVARDAKVNYVLSNSFGFGGQNTCLVFGGGAQGGLSHDPHSRHRRRQGRRRGHRAGARRRPATMSTSPIAPRATPRRRSPTS